MNFLHLQFENLAYEGCKFWSDIFFELGQISKVHPVVANMIVFLSFVLGFGIFYLFFDFIEKEYMPKIRASVKSIKRNVQLLLSNIKAGFNRTGKKWQKRARKMVKVSIYLAIIAVPLFLMGTTLRGGVK